jgi:EAL domain-containing protein (putative c-di-GMP-specific phosphodiesterase class I)
MVALRNLGVSLTLDDFGTGHAGLSYLRRFPFSKIKIDRSFVRNLGGDRESDAIVEAILLLGRRLNLRVVAEGVEHEAQLEQLRRMQCPYVQGYLTGRPVSAEIARAL